MGPLSPLYFAWFGFSGLVVWFRLSLPMPVLYLLFQALPLVGFHFQKVGRKPQLTLLWEPEKPEQEAVQQVKIFSPLLSDSPPPSSSRRAINATRHLSGVAQKAI